MSEKIEWPVLGPMELVRGLTLCAKPGLDGCDECPMGGVCEDMKCAPELLRQAGAMIGRLYDAGEKAAEGLSRKLVDMAREGNTALERGLEGVNQAKLAEMTAVQDELEAFGRGCAIRAEPAGRQDGSMRIVEVTVEGRVVFSGEDAEKEPVIANQSADWCGDPVDHAECMDGVARNPLGIATSPAAPRNDMKTGGPDG